MDSLSLTPSQIGEDRCFPIPYKIIFAGLSGTDDLKPQELCPGIQVEKIPGLVSVYKGVNRAVFHGDLVQNGAADTVRLLGNHIHVDSLFQSPDCCVRADCRISGAFHKGGDSALGHQPVIADNDDGVLRGSLDLFSILAYQDGLVTEAGLL